MDDVKGWLSSSFASGAARRSDQRIAALGDAEVQFASDVLCIPLAEADEIPSVRCRRQRRQGIDDRPPSTQFLTDLVAGEIFRWTRFIRHVFHRSLSVLLDLICRDAPLLQGTLWPSPLRQEHWLSIPSAISGRYRLMVHANPHVETANRQTSLSGHSAMPTA